jgi:hypothetical protein
VNGVHPVNGEKQPGTYTVQFDARGLPSGIYLCRLEAAGRTFTRKMILAK